MSPVLRIGLLLGFANLSVAQAPITIDVTTPQILDALPVSTISVRLVDFPKDALRHLPRLRNLRHLEVREKGAAVRRLSDADCEWIARLTKLESLRIPRCEITKKGLAALARLPALRELEFGNASEDPADYAPLAKFASLAHLAPRLNFGRDGIGILDVIGQIRTLRSLDFRDNRTLTSAGVQKLGALTELRELDFRGCDGLSRRSDRRREPGLDGIGLDDAGLLALSKLRKLKHLDLFNCISVTGKGLAVIAGMPALEVLDVTNCSAIKAEGFGVLPPGLRVLRAHGTSIDIRGLRRLERVEDLSLSWCTRLSDADLAALRGNRLRRVDLTYCKALTAKSLEVILRWKAVTDLNLFGTKWLSDDVLGRIATITALERLNIGGNLDYSDAGIAHLAALRKLRFLDIRACKRLTTAGVLALHEVPLRELVIYMCRGVDAQEVRRRFPDCTVK